MGDCRCILIGQPFASIPAMNDAAILETFLADGILHYLIVSVRINADAMVVLQSILHGKVHDAFHFTVAGYAVDGGIGKVVQPCSVINDVICRVVAASKHKGGYNLAFQEADVAVSTFDVFPKQLFAWIPCHPLGRVAGSCHEFSCGGEDFLKLGNIFGG